MHDLSPGQEVTVSGHPATVVYVRDGRDGCVRIRMHRNGKERTVSRSRVSTKPTPKALSVVFSDFEVADIRERMMRAAAPIVVGGGHALGSSLRPVPKPVTLTSEPYLAYVRKHPCCVCGRTEGVVAHHWSHHGASTGKKVDDYRTVPLCDPCHMGEWHRTGTFPGMSRKASDALMLRVQRNLLLDWTATRISDGDMVDALIRAIGGAS